MEKESFICGYCRNIDESRMVVAITENSRLLEVDCNYETCPYTPNCTIAQNIRQLLQQ